MCLSGQRTGNPFVAQHSVYIRYVRPRSREVPVTTRTQDADFASDYRRIDVYRLLLDRLLPTDSTVPVRCAVFAITPERFDPYSPGVRDPKPFGYPGSIPKNRPYPVVAFADSPSTAKDDAVLHVYLGPVEWQGPDDAVVEAGVSVGGGVTRHWVWRVGRIDTGWVVFRCELLWGG